MKLRVTESYGKRDNDSAIVHLRIRAWLTTCFNEVGLPRGSLRFAMPRHARCNLRRKLSIS